jgi:hypothetical protein
MITHPAAAVEAEREESVAAAVLRCRAVARLHAGPFNAITSYLPGRRVVGVAVTPSAVTVGVVGRYPATVAEIAAQARAAVCTVLPGVVVNVAVEDIDLAGDTVAGVDAPAVQTDQRRLPPVGSERSTSRST